MPGDPHFLDLVSMSTLYAGVPLDPYGNPEQYKMRRWEPDQLAAALLVIPGTGKGSVVVPLGQDKVRVFYKDGVALAGKILPATPQIDLKPIIKPARASWGIVAAAGTGLAIGFIGIASGFFFHSQPAAVLIAAIAVGPLLLV